MENQWTCPWCHTVNPSTRTVCNKLTCTFVRTPPREDVAKIGRTWPVGEITDFHLKERL